MNLDITYNNAVRNQTHFKPIADNGMIALTDKPLPCWKPKKKWNFKCKSWIKKSTHQHYHINKNGYFYSHESIISYGIPLALYTISESARSFCANGASWALNSTESILNQRQAEGCNQLVELTSKPFLHITVVPFTQWFCCCWIDHFHSLWLYLHINR